jgi:hypothetical protein
VNPVASTAPRGAAGAPRGAAPALAGATARRPLRALSIDAGLLRRLRTVPAPARVHSVFERVINVDLGAGRLLALACRGADDAPDSVVVDLDSWSAAGVAAGAEVRFEDRRIEFDRGPCVTLDGARPWLGRLPAYPKDPAALRVNLPAARDHLDRHGRGLGADRAPTPALRAVMAATFRDHVDGLCRALAGGDGEQAREHVDRLVGLGTGLTPSGDDFLLGLLAALHLPRGPAGRWRRIGAHVVERAGRQTHPISAAALRHAACGRVRARIVGLCEALASEPLPRVLPALERVMAIGSGSGSEIAHGVLAGLRLHVDCAVERRMPDTNHRGLRHGR